LSAPLALLSLIVVTSRAVVVSCLHTALLETYDQSRTDRDRSCLVSRKVPYRSGPRGKPRLTLVSEGKPLRRLLLGSNKNSLFTVVLLPNGLPVTSERGTAESFYRLSGVLQS